MARYRLSLWLVRSIILPTSICLSGCLPIKVPRSIRTPSGLQATLPSKLPVVAKSTRGEVEARFQSIAVETGIPNLFWGRYVESDWAVVAAPLPGTVSGRDWQARDILVSFDENGIVRSCSNFSEWRLFKYVAGLQQDGILPPLDLTQPITVRTTSSGSPSPLVIDLSSTEMTLHLSTLIQLPVEDMGPLEFDPATPYPGAFQSSNFHLMIHSSARSVLHLELNLIASPADTLTLIRWYHQVKLL